MNLRIAVVFLALLLSACGQAIHDPAGIPPGDNGGGELGNGKAISFATVKEQIFTPHCARCHGAFEDYSKTYPLVKQIQDSVQADRMPKRGPLSAELKALLTAWIDQGAPEGG